MIKLVSDFAITFNVIGSGPLWIKIKFDGRELFSKFISDQDSVITVRHRFLNWPRAHRLVVEIAGKTPDMTVMDEDFNILSDTLFKIHSVTLNGVDTGEVFFQTSQYTHTHNGSSEPVTQTPSDVSGFNGHISWNFTTPVHRWMYRQGITDTPDLLQRWCAAWPQAKKILELKIANTFGINIFRLAKLVYFPKYLRDLRHWRRQGGRVDGYHPILAEFSGTEAGQATGAYFYQDIMVAQHILGQHPQRHLTIGSNLTGFVGHVATFMPVTVGDVRPLTTISHPNISFVHCDLGRPDLEIGQLMSDSVSCLSCLHHVGNGRYGDAVNPNGPFVALANLRRMVSPGGFLYIGTSVGPESRVLFNHSRTFTVKEILDHLPDFELVRFDCYNGVGDVICENLTEDELGAIPEHSYGIFVLRSRLSS